MKKHRFLNTLSVCLLTLAVFVSLALLTPIKADAATYNGFTYTVSGGKATITGYSGAGGDITIPSALGGYPVTGIGNSAFFGCESLGSVIIPDSVTSIGDSAFFGCASLGSVTIPDSVTSIGGSAFYYCTRLGSVTIPDSVKSIGNDAFSGCDNLGSVTIGNSVTSIGDGAFFGCTSLQSATIPDSVTSIGYSAFSGCDNLASVTIPDSVTSIGNYAFFCCYSLASVTIGNSVESIGNSAFYSCCLESVTIPDSVKSIGAEAFFGCASLGSVTIPDSVKSIGAEAFNLCYNLTNVYYGGTRSQWESISIGSENAYLTSATIHYNHIHDFEILAATTVNPTCTEPGYIEYTCVFGDTYRETLPALGHTTGSDAVVTPPTCTEQGYTTSACPRCSQTLTTDYVPALDHDYSGPVGTAEPTCTAEGYTGKTCTRCEDIEKTNIVDSLGHKMVVIPASDPTCEKPGLTAGTACQRCGLVGVAQKETAPANGHNYIGHEAKAPTCAEIGWAAYQTCENCDYSTYVEQPAGHRVYTETTVLVDPITVTNDSDMPFVLVDGVYYSQNHTDGSASEFTITVQYDCTVKFICGVSSESGWDKLYILINDYQSVNLSGEQNGYAYEHNLHAGDIVTIRYSKDGSVNNGDDRGWVQLTYEDVSVTGMGDVLIDTLNPSCVNPITCTYCDTVVGHNMVNGICTDCGNTRVRVKITNVTLRPSCSGLYFKGTFEFASDVSVNRYGIAVSLYNDLPVADGSDETSLYTVGENSVLISNILGEGKTGKDLIYARPYALLEDGTYIYGDVVATNLKAVVETIETQVFDSLTTVQKTAIADMYLQHTAVMQHWLIPKIKEFGEA